MARRLLSLLALLALGATLGGCNLVYSQTPLFKPADPPLKTGVWGGPDPGCAFDESKPVAEWPQCAHGGIVRADALVDPAKPDKPTPYVLGPGDPRVLQAPLVGDKDKVIYLYAAVQPLKFDDQGRIIEFESWLAQCGPPPPQPKTNELGKKPPLTQHPLPGLRLDPDTSMCEATAPGPVQNAARKSRPWADNINHLHWIRDGEK